MSEAENSHLPSFFSCLLLPALLWCISRSPLKEGSTKDILKDYIGHIEETPIYDGNVCLAAHNRGNKYSYFAKINQLQNGDNIVYKTDFFEKHYIVDNIKVIDETDWTLLEDTGEEKITLITCIKNQKSKRLCVQAIKVD